MQRNVLILAMTCALAAFYLLAAGEEERAKPYLEKAGAAADEVTAAFK